MLHLLHRRGVFLLRVEEAAPPPLLTDAQKEDVLQNAEKELFDLQQLLGVMHKQGFKDTKEYQELVTLYTQLSRSIMEAIKSTGLAATLAVSKAAGAASQALAGSTNVPKRLRESIGQDISRFGTSLGPATMRGMTSQGEEVENLQKVLNWEKISVSIDGIYSPETMVAVRTLQKKYGINPTGTVGAETRRLLNTLIGKD